MCGRFAVWRPVEELASFFDAEISAGESPPPSYNVAPTAQVHAVADTRSGRRMGTMSWGLVPSWSEGPGSGPRPINARAETLLDKALFAEAFLRRRCLVPADGFYEWEKTEQGKQPYLIRATDGAPLALAGLWDRWIGADGTALVTCTIVTTVANAVVGPLHDRMPAILERQAWATWLGPTRHDATLMRLLEPAPDDLIEACPASRLVNSVANDGPELLGGVHPGSVGGRSAVT